MSKFLFSVVIVFLFQSQSAIALWQKPPSLRETAIEILEKARAKGITRAVKSRIQLVLAPYTDNIIVQDLGAQIDAAARSMPLDMQVQLAKSLFDDQNIYALLNSPSTPKDPEASNSSTLVSYSKDIMYLNQTTPPRFWKEDSRLRSGAHIAELKKKLNVVGPVIALDSGKMLALQVFEGEDQSLMGKFLEVEVGTFGEPDVAKALSPIVFPAADAMKIYESLQERLQNTRRIRSTNISFAPFSQFALDHIVSPDRPFVSVCTAMACTVVDIVVSPFQAIRWAWRRAWANHRTGKELEKLGRLSTKTDLIVFPFDEYHATNTALLEELAERYSEESQASVCTKALIH